MAAEAVLQSLRHVWRALEPLGVPVALMGGLALSVWKHVRATRDVDLLVGIAEHRVDGILQCLEAAAIRPKRSPPVVSLGQLDVIQLLYEPPEAFVDLQIDLLLAKSEYSLESLRRRIPTQLPGIEFTIAVLTCEDMILHKLLAGRLIDQIDAAALLRINRHAMDYEYLGKWARDLKLSKELADAWQQAIPGEPIPQVLDGG